MPARRSATHQQTGKRDTEAAQDAQIADRVQTTTNDAAPKVYTVLEVAAILGISRETVFALLRTKELGSILIGKRGRRITDVQLDTYLRILEGRPPDGP